MEKRKPLKRHPVIQPISRQHHFGLLLCWKIRKGIDLNIDFNRIKSYAKWFFNTYLQPLFRLEQNHIYPILGDHNTLVKKAIRQQRKVARLLFEKDNPEMAITLFEEELERHIRFEERILFEEVQRKASAKEIQSLSKVIPEVTFIENTNDMFWKESK